MYLFLNSESDILNHSDELETFYSSFIALATHYICSSVGCREFDNYLCRAESMMYLM